MKLLDGKSVKEILVSKITEEIAPLIARGEKPPRVDVILVGDDLGSKKYVEMKTKLANQIGFESFVHTFSSDVSEKELASKIEELNLYRDVTGFFLQLPLPINLDSNRIINMISPDKDIDGLTSTNLGKLFQGSDDAILSATPRGILMLLDHYGVDIEGKNIVIVGWSKIVGMPLLAVLTNRGGTVTVCHDKTTDLKSHTSAADILISATGVAGLIKREDIKEGAVVIDVGISIDPSGRISGDVDAGSVGDKPSWLTPVPGGVGPMTVAALMLNVFDRWKKRYTQNS